ncbi:tripartite tricarboxylate transporter substrate binding protein [Ramlibacter sp. RBP-2]|uniref:Tripartite tricarboxylate transporter substrate binding protein n=1 Tax=Ramlibacter lithotrophicus TaxID=2606681 RepID=A0A7X6DJ24_9BURK|nr:tripartite tricarboxylate transporter substrate binding protein [Ramlibacter lithotrophicus]NKE68040.1 tripartite tricarboxylate transporter substrate binding protein [Ramlibacter lithotrophicus]
MDRNRRLTTLACLAALGSAAFPVRAQGKWPSKPITYVVPFAAGGTTDVLARTFGQRLSVLLGQPVVVDNKPGAGGNVGSAFVAKAPADGYTILGGTISSHSINVSLYPNMPYDPVKDFVPVALYGTLPNVLVVKADSPFKSVADVVAAAKAKQNLSYSSSGAGTSQHLSGELFKNMAGVDILHVPYKGSSPSMQALLGDQVTMCFENILSCIPLIQSGKLRALGVTSTTRASGLPDVPTMAEAGLKGFEIVSWQGVFAPAGTPAPVVEQLSTTILKIIQEPEIKAKLLGLGLEPSTMTQAQFAAFQKAEVAKWAKLIKAANIKLD